MGLDSAFTSTPYNDLVVGESRGTKLVLLYPLWISSAGNKSLIPPIPSIYKPYKPLVSVSISNKAAIMIFLGWPLLDLLFEAGENRVLVGNMAGKVFLAEIRVFDLEMEKVASFI